MVNQENHPESNSDFYKNFRWRRNIAALSLGVGALMGVDGAPEIDASAHEIQQKNITLDENQVSENSQPKTDHFEIDEYLEEIDLTEIGRETVDFFKETSPYIWALGGIILSSMVLSKNDKNTSKLKIANRGYGRREDKAWRDIMRGTLIPALGAIVLTTSFSIEEEIRNGPNRVINAMESEYLEEESENDLYWMLQNGTEHMMNNSEIFNDNPAELNKLLEEFKDQEIGALPFHLELADVESIDGNQTSMIISPAGNTKDALTLLPKVVEETAQCEISNGRCILEEGEVAVDANEGYKIGDKLTIRGEEFEVVAHTEQPRSLLNRLVVYTNSNSMENIRGSQNPYYGLAISAENIAKINESLKSLDMIDDVDVLDTEQFLVQNAEFWEGNGTTLMMLLILNISIFGGISLYEKKRAEQEENREHIALLRALGYKSSDIAQIEAADSVITTTKATLPVFPAAWGVAEIANAGITGFNSEVDALMVVGASGTILAAKLAGVGFLTQKIRKISPGENLE